MNDWDPKMELPSVMSFQDAMLYWIADGVQRIAAALEAAEVRVRG